MLVDANVLLFAVDRDSPFHSASKRWIEDTLRRQGVSFPWQSLVTFLRVGTHPRVFARPLLPREAWDYVEDWLLAPNASIPAPGKRYTSILGSLVQRYQLSGDSLPDAALAALALEHGLGIASADTDFARFTEVEWVNPLAT